MVFSARKRIEEHKRKVQENFMLVAKRKAEEERKQLDDVAKVKAEVERKQLEDLAKVKAEE